MFNFIRKINISKLGLGNLYEHFIAQKNGFIYCSNKEIKLFDITNDTNKHICQAENAIFLKKDQNGLFINENYNTLIVCDSEKKTKKHIKSGFDEFLLLVDSNTAIYYSETDNNYYFSLYDFKKKVLKWKLKNLKGLRTVDGLIFTYYNELLSKLNNETGKIDWKSSLKKFTSYSNERRFIGAYKNILIAGIGTDWLIGIDTTTGQLAWKQKLTPNFVIIDKEKGVLYSLIGIFIKIDPLSGKILDFFNNRNYFEKEIGITSQRNNYVIVGEHLITTDWRKGKIGAFNTKTHKFDWTHQEKGVYFPGGSPMKYMEPYLFVKDNKGYLHIFKKTED